MKHNKLIAEVGLLLAGVSLGNRSQSLVEVRQDGQQNTGEKIKYVGCDTRNSVEVGFHHHG